MTVKKIVDQIETLYGRQSHSHLFQLINDALLEISAKKQHYTVSAKANLSSGQRWYDLPSRTIDVVRVENGILFIEMHGGCQGCSSSKYTLQSGVEQKIKEKFPEIISIQDITDHDAGENPYYE